MEPQDGRLRMPEHFHTCIGTRGVAPLHGRQSSRHLEGGMVRVRWNRRESIVGLGPDRVRGCSYGLTYRNQVEESTGQSPSDESQRARSRGQMLQD